MLKILKDNFHIHGGKLHQKRSFIYFGEDIENPENFTCVCQWAVGILKELASTEQSIQAQDPPTTT